MYQYVALLLILIVTHTNAKVFGSWSLLVKKNTEFGESKPQISSQDILNNKKLISANKKYESDVDIEGISYDLVKVLIKQALQMAGSPRHNIYLSLNQLKVNIPHNLIGWKVYDYNVIQKEKENIVELHFMSQSDIIKKSKQAKIVLTFQIQDSFIRIRLKYGYKGVSESDVVYAVSALHEAFTKYLKDQLDMSRKRSKYVKTISTQSKADAMKRKQLELDKIINPDKYRKKGSGNVRNPGAGVGGRYDSLHFT